MKALLILTFLFFTTLVYSQDSHFALSMGPSFALADFSEMESYTSNGYAQQGFVLSFEGNYVPTWYFGIGGQFAFGTNFPDQDSMHAAFINELIVNQYINEEQTALESEFSVDNWNYVNLLVGPTLAYPAGKLQFNIKTLIGLSIIMAPNEVLQLNNNQSELSINSDAQDVGFAYAVGADVILKLSGNYSVKLGAEYFSTNATYKVHLSKPDESLPSIERKVNVQSLHATLGLAYLF